MTSHGPGSRLPERITFAANNREMGGGEVMLLRLATAAEELGCEAQVVAPCGELVDAATSAGLRTVVLPGTGRSQQARELRRWVRGTSPGLLWCNGLVPALATAGMRGRVVHLHHLPEGAQVAATAVARRGAAATVVPSQFMARRIRGASVLPNWSDEVRVPSGAPRSAGPVRIGFIGRLGLVKGVDVLATAVSLLADEGRDVRLVVAGAPMYVPNDEAISARRALDRLGPGVLDLGWVAREDFFAQVDLAVFPSRMLEAFGLVVTEAMSAGVPFVISDAGALPEVAGPRHPWVSRAGDPHGLARAIGAALDALPAADTRQAARQRWLDLYSPQAGVRHLRALLASIGAPGREVRPSTAEHPGNVEGRRQPERTAS